MNQLSRKIICKKKNKVNVLQFGEGNFLRAFVNYIMQQLSDAGAKEFGVAVVQPMPFGRVSELDAQDGLYTVILEGIEKGKTIRERKIVDVLSDFINPYTQYDKYLEYAKDENLQLIVSNTTEAGIALDKTDTDLSVCPKGFVAKLLAFLFRRYEHFCGDMSKGLGIVPCELIDYNGDELLRVLIELADIIGLSADFKNWLCNANHFTNTLVDRIVPGFPRDDAEKIYNECGYIDNSLVKCEPFHLWVIEQNEFIQGLLPIKDTGLNVIFPPDITPYKQRKVKILNGTHTAIVPVAYLCGIDTVREAITDADVRQFALGLIYNEINPTISLSEGELNDFAQSVLERFENPFVRHELMSIALNSTSKFKTRLLPTLKDYIAKFNTVPKRLVFALAALSVFNRGKREDGSDIKLCDNEQYLKRWQQLFSGGALDLTAQQILQEKDFFDCDITTLNKEILPLFARYLGRIAAVGMRNALKELNAE